MTRTWQMMTLAATLLLGTSAVLAATPAERAQRNVELLRSGAKKISDLSDAERRELAAAEQLAESKSTDHRTPRQRCIDEEVKHAGGNPSKLTMRTIDLKCSQR